MLILKRPAHKMGERCFMCNNEVREQVTVLEGKQYCPKCGDYFLGWGEKPEQPCMGFCECCMQEKPVTEIVWSDYDTTICVACEGHYKERRCTDACNN